MIFRRFGFDHAGDDGVDAHLVRRPLLRQRTGHVDQPGLGRAVRCRAGRWPHAGNAGDVDDAAAVFIFTEGVIGLLGKHQGRDQVQADDGLGKFGRRVGCLDRRTATGVVDQHVEATAALQHGVNQLLRFFRLAHVSGDEFRLPAVALRQLCRCIAAADKHAGAGLQKSLRDAKAHTLGAAGDDDAFIAEVGHGSSVFR